MERSKSQAEAVSDEDNEDKTRKPVSSQPQSVVVAGWAISNVALSVGLVTINKMLMQTYGFKFVFSLTFCHFATTSVFLELMTRLRWFGASAQYMPWNVNVLTAAAGVASIAFMNLSLKFNSIGFYQITKLCVIPVVLLIEFFQFGKTVSQNILLALLLLLAGVGIATVTDVELNRVGLVYAVLAVLCTAQFQIWQGTKQKLYKLSPIQMTHSVAIPQSLITLLAACIFEQDVTRHKFHPDYVDVGLVLLTCLMAIGVNITSMGLIGKTSAVTFQVVGHAKTCLIIASGLFFFSSSATGTQTLKNLAGVFIAVLAMVRYGHLKGIEAAKASVKDEDSVKADRAAEELEHVAAVDASAGKDEGGLGQMQEEEAPGTPNKVN